MDGCTKHYSASIGHRESRCRHSVWCLVFIFTLILIRPSCVDTMNSGIIWQMLNTSSATVPWIHLHAFQCTYLDPPYNVNTLPYITLTLLSNCSYPEHSYIVDIDGKTQCLWNSYLASKWDTYRSIQWKFQTLAKLEAYSYPGLLHHYCPSTPR